MRFFKVFLLSCLLTTAALSQKPVFPLLGSKNIPVLKLKSQLDVGGINERIIVKKFLDDESRLLVITNYGIKLWNVKTNELLKSYPHEIGGLDKFNVGCAVNPDGTKAIVFELFEFSLKKFFRKKKVSATVYDLETGSQIKVLERPKESIRQALWTKDGKTLITFSNSSASDSKSEISFWDAETLSFRGSITTNNGIYLTKDGNRFITSAPITQNTFGYKNDDRTSIKIWDLQTLKIDKDFPLPQIKSLDYTIITPDEKFLITEKNKQIFLLNLADGNQKSFTTKEKNSIDSFRISSDNKYLYGGEYNNVFIWEIDGNGLPKFEITANQQADKYHFAVVFAGFSEDARYAVVSQNKFKKALGFIAYDSSEKFEYHNLETGTKEPNLNTYFTDSSSIISANKDFGVSTTCRDAVVYNNRSQQELYKFGLTCKSYTSTTTNSKGETETETHYYNDDIVAFHPSKNIFLVAKDDSLEVYSVDAEQRQVQKIFTPKNLSKSSSNKSFSTNHLSNISSDSDSNNLSPDIPSAGFVADGSYVYALSRDKKTIFFWEVDQSLID